MTTSSTELAPLVTLERLARANCPMVVSECADLDWIETLATRLGDTLERPAFRWSLAGGLVPLCLKGAGNASLRKPADVITYLGGQNSIPSIVVLTDIAAALDSDEIQSALRDLARDVDKHGHLLILTTFGEALPAALRPYASPYDPGLPNSDQLREVIVEEANFWGTRNHKRVKASRTAIDAVVRIVLGLTRAEARKIIRIAIADGVLDDADLPGLLAGKHEILSAGGVLSFEPHSEKLANVAGMGQLKSWLELRKLPFLADRAPKGLDRPKGLLLLGVQGAGKSLSAKAVAGTWGVPLLKLDMGALYNKYHGETERNLRDSLRAADVMAPCVLWIDEIEKGLAGDSEDGLSRRVMGTLLTWMAERKSRTFLVATANDISLLPPELLRKGRFDEIFFVDLPNAQVRSDAFGIHLKRREFDPSAFDLGMLSEVTEGFTGAEIEQVVVSGAYAAVAASGDLTTDLLIHSAKSTVPLSVTRRGDLLALREWARERTVPAEIPVFAAEPPATPAPSEALKP